MCKTPDFHLLAARVSDPETLYIFLSFCDEIEILTCLPNASPSANFANGKLHFVFIFVLKNMIVWLLFLSERKPLCQIQISQSEGRIPSW